MRSLAGFYLVGFCLAPWLYIGTGIYVALERPGFTPWVSFVSGTLVGALAVIGWIGVSEWAEKPEAIR